MKRVIVSAIAAMAENRAIGRNNELLWRIPEDLRRFRETTMGRPVVMGRRTFESIGKPLPGRTNIVVSRTGFSAEDVIVCKSLEDALNVAREREHDEIFIIGGAQIYEQALPFINRIYLTLVHKTIEGDAFFPALGGEWREISSLPHEGDPPFTFKVLERK